MRACIAILTCTFTGLSITLIFHSTATHVRIKWDYFSILNSWVNWFLIWILSQTDLRHRNHTCLIISQEGNIKSDGKRTNTYHLSDRHFKGRKIRYAHIPSPLVDNISRLVRNENTRSITSKLSYDMRVELGELSLIKWELSLLCSARRRRDGIIQAKSTN